MAKLMRLDKYLADMGCGTRTQVKDAIKKGRVSINDEKIKSPETKIDIETTIVYMDGQPISYVQTEYYMLNKPQGVVSATEDRKYKTVIDLIDDKSRKDLFPVGRLDMYTSGALLLSNDGEFVNKITHPSHEIEKTYNVTVRGKITKEDMEKLESGVDIGDYITKPARTKILKVDENKNISRFQIIIHEGKNRQIRRMCKAINKPVLALHRAAIGKISVKNLKIGQYRFLTEREIEDLIK